MLCVILGHSVNFWTNNWITFITPVEESFPLKVISDFINSFHIYAFTLVSGYLFCFLKYEKGKYQKYKPFFVKKVYRLVVPYFFIAIIWVIPISAVFNQYGWREIVKKYILGISPNQLWFLLMLFWVFIISWPFSNLFRKHFFICTLFVGFFYILGVLGNHYCANYFNIWTGFEYTLFFWMGFEIRNYEYIFTTINPLLWSIGFLTCFYLWEFGTLSLLIKSIVTILLHVMGALSSFTCLRHLGMKFENWKNNKLFASVSEKSMAIYLLHQQIIYFILFLLNGKVNPYLLALICFICSLGLAYFISSILMKYNIFRLLLGEKAR